MTTASPATQPAIAQNTSAAAASKTASDVAWAFIPQYYQHMNEKPDRLYRFYTKNSTFLHGVEGEDTSLCHGQTDIRKRITELEYKDCKVFIHSVDAQASVGGSILVNVIGEMCNDPQQTEQWRKFVQTFFLAEQATGYYVHNDNFRYLKEESFTDDEEEQIEQQQQHAEPSHVGESQPYAAAHTNGYHHHEQAAVPEPVTQHIEPEPVQEPTPEPPVIPEVRAPTPPPPAPEPAAPTPEVHEPAPEPAAAALPSPSPSPVNVHAIPAPATASETPSSTTPAAPTKPVAQAPIAPPKPSGPPAPKTWANLAAANSAKWGQTVAQEAKGVSTAPPPQANPPAASPNAAAVRANANVKVNPNPSGPKPVPRDQQHPAYAAALAVTTSQCFVKGVTENIPEERLSEILTERFGPIKECEVVRSKACAFLEFKTPESARRAIIASLPVNQGGEGGIHLDEKEFGAPARLNIEIRKERGDRPPPRPRGGAPGGAVGGHSGEGSSGSRGGGSGFRGGATRGRGRGDGYSGGRGGPR